MPLARLLAILSMVAMALSVGVYSARQSQPDQTPPADGAVFLAATDAGLRIVNASAPANPLAVGAERPPTTTLAVAVVGRYAYVASGRGGLRVLDVSDAARPEQVGAVPLDANVDDIAVADGYAYLADIETGVWIVNVTTPTAPDLTGHIAEGAASIAVAHGIAYLVNGQELHLFGVADPAKPDPLGRLDGGAMDVAVDDGIAYLVHPATGLQLVNVADPNKPAKLGALPLPVPAQAVAVAGNVAYIATGGRGLQLVDVRDVNQPREAGMDSGPAFDVAVATGLAFIAADDAGLRILDIRTPSQPVPLGAVQLGGAAVRVALAAQPPDCGEFELSDPSSIPNPGLISFDELANDMLIGSAYKDSHGVIFESSRTTRALAVQDRRAKSAPNVAVNRPTAATGDSASIPLRIDFLQSKTHVGLWMGNGTATFPLPGILTAYDARGEAICRVVKSPVPSRNVEEFIGLTNPDGRIAGVTLDYGSAGNPEVIDDLTFAPYTQPTETATPTDTATATRPSTPTATATATRALPSATPTATERSTSTPTRAGPRPTRDPRRKWMRHSHGDSILPADHVRFVALGPDGSTWIRVRMAGDAPDPIVEVDRNGSWHAYSGLKDVVEKKLAAIRRFGVMRNFVAMDQAGRAWIGPEYFNGQKWTTVAMDDEQVGGGMRLGKRALTDPSDQAWVPSASSVDCLRPEGCAATGMRAYTADGEMKSSVLFDPAPEAGEYGIADVHLVPGTNGPMASRELLGGGILPQIQQPARLWGARQGTGTSAWAVARRALYQVPATDPIYYPHLGLTPDERRNAGYATAAALRPDGRLQVFTWVELHSGRTLAHKILANTWTASGWEVEDLTDSPLFGGSVEFVRAVAAAYAGDGSLWIASSTGDLGMRLNSDWDVFTPDDSPLPQGGGINDIVVGPDGSVWIATDAGLLFYGIPGAPLPRGRVYLPFTRQTR